MADLILAGVDDKLLITVCCGAVIFFFGIWLALSRLNESRRRETGQNMGSRSADDDRRSYNDVCPICLGAHRLAVETNCCHKFCGSCLESCLNRPSGDFALFGRPLPCPLCRQEVNIFLLGFTQEESASADLRDERASVERMAHQYNVRFGGGPRSLWSYVEDCPVLIRHMLSEFFTLGGLLCMFRLRVMLCCLGTLIYFINPLDIIPEAMFGLFGFLDDIVVFLLSVIYISIMYRRFVIRRASNTT